MLDGFTFGVKLTLDDNSKELLQGLVNTVGKYFPNIQPPVSHTEPENDLIFIKEASELTNLAEPTIRTLTCKKKIPYIKPAGTKRLMFSRKAIIEWLQTGRPTNAQQKANEYINNRK